MPNLLTTNLGLANIAEISSVLPKMDYKGASIATKEIKLQQRIKELETQKGNLATQSEEDKAELTESKQKLDAIEDSKNKKDEILGFISYMPAELLGDIKTMLDNRIKFFNRIGIAGMIVSVSVFFVYLVCLFCELPLPDNVAKYAMYVFFVVFPMLIAFMSYRQSNIKNKELETINDTIIKNQNIYGAINAIHMLSPSDKADENMLQMIQEYASKEMGLPTPKVADGDLKNDGMEIWLN